MFAHASDSKIFYSVDEGVTWNSMTFSISTIDPRTLVWNSKRDQWALAHDLTNDVVNLFTNAVVVFYSVYSQYSRGGHC